MKIEPEAWVLTDRTPFKEQSINIVAKQVSSTRMLFRAEILLGKLSFTGEGHSLSDALRDLADKVEKARIFGAEFIGPPEVQSKMRRCKYCHAEIFFVKTRNNKWLPTDGRQVDFNDIPAEDLLENRVKPFLVLDANGELRLSYNRLRGMVWIPHPLVCGTNTEPPLVEALKSRWEENRKDIAAVRDDTVEHLKNVLAELRRDGIQ